jgi:hypothetical protein
VKLAVLGLLGRVVSLTDVGLEAIETKGDDLTKRVSKMKLIYIKIGGSAGP